MSEEDKNTLAILERDLTDLNDKIKNAQNKKNMEHMEIMLAMRDEYEQKINKLRDKLGY